MKVHLHCRSHRGSETSTTTTTTWIGGRLLFAATEHFYTIHAHAPHILRSPSLRNRNSQPLNTRRKNLVISLVSFFCARDIPMRYIRVHQVGLTTGTRPRVFHSIFFFFVSKLLLLLHDNNITRMAVSDRGGGSFLNAPPRERKDTTLLTDAIGF